MDRWHIRSGVVPLHRGGKAVLCVRDGCEDYVVTTGGTCWPHKPETHEPPTGKVKS